MLRHIPAEKPWDDEIVTVAEMESYDDPYYPGVRMLWSALVSNEQLAALNGELRRLSHEVESSGRPGPGSAGELNPKFYISAEIDGSRLECEPLILGWLSNDRTAMALDPRFAMTYGLMPRAVGDGTIHWDDPALPEFDVAIIDPPSQHLEGWQSGARARVLRTYLQDYLSLRGLHLVQVYFEQRRAEQDQAIKAFLGRAARREEQFEDRVIDVMTRDNGGFVAQAWGARYVAGPGPMPVTEDDLDHAGLQWPGYATPVTHAIARRQRPSDYVYVNDAVLAAYEGNADFQIYPPSGGVSFGSQWSVGFCERVGRDVIRIEIKKLYEGTPNRVTRHWHSHAIAPRPEHMGTAGPQARNIATRAEELTFAIVSLGERLAALAALLNCSGFTGKDFVQLDRAHLEYHGWWTDQFVEPVTRHAPATMARTEFLSRCLDLNKLAIEALAERYLRPMVRAIGPPQDDIDGLRGLKLLDRLVCLAQVSNAAGLSLASAGAEIVDRYHRDGTSPAKPLDRLFALSDLRQLEGHRKRDVEELAHKAIARFGIAVAATKSGWGLALDNIYDRLIEEIGNADRVLSEALAMIDEA